MKKFLWKNMNQKQRYKTTLCLLPLAIIASVLSALKIPEPYNITTIIGICGVWLMGYDAYNPKNIWYKK